MHGSEERQKMVLAHAIKLDVLYHYHLVALFFEYRAVDDLLNIGVIAAGEKAQRLIGALWCTHQTRALRIFTDLQQQLLHQSGYGFFVLLRLHYFHNIVLVLHGLSSKTFLLVSRRRIPSSRGHSPGNTPA